MDKRGFTLAETLIALTIIGVIATIAISVIYKNYQRKNVATKVAKFYSTIQNALDLSTVENGPMWTWEATPTAIGKDGGAGITNKYLVPFLNITNTDLESINTWKTNSTICNAYSVSKPNSNELMFDHLCFSTYRLKDGMCFCPQMIDDGKSKFNNQQENFGDFYFDINCEKGPNKVGKDVFAISFYKDNNTETAYIAPYASPKNLSSSTRNSRNRECSSGSNAFHCTYWLLKEGFNKIPKDYPWL